MSPPSVQFLQPASWGAANPAPGARPGGRVRRVAPSLRERTKPATKLVLSRDNRGRSGLTDQAVERLRGEASGPDVPGQAPPAPPAWASTFDDDEVFRVGPESRRVRDLHRVPADLAVVVRRRLERRRVLARHDPVLLVRSGQRQLGEMPPVGHREYGRIEIAGRHERLPALPQDEEEPGAAFL